MSKSTSIHDLPQNSSMPEEESQEAMMVNSILQEIEQEEEAVNDENMDSLNYVMDTSQVPPKINNEIPTPEVIKTATEEIFQNVEMLPPIETKDFPEKEEKEEIIKVLENKEEKPEEEDKKPKNKNLSGIKDIDGILNKIKKKAVAPIIILILFMILTHSKINKFIIQKLPKLGNLNGEVNMLGNLIKGLILAIVNLVVSIFI